MLDRGQHLTRFGPLGSGHMHPPAHSSAGNSFAHEEMLEHAAFWQLASGRGGTLPSCSSTAFTTAHSARGFTSSHSEECARQHAGGNEVLIGYSGEASLSTHQELASSPHQTAQGTAVRQSSHMGTNSSGQRNWSITQSGIRLSSPCTVSARRQELVHGRTSTRFSLATWNSRALFGTHLKQSVKQKWNTFFSYAHCMTFCTYRKLMGRMLTWNFCAPGSLWVLAAFSSLVLLPLRVAASFPCFWPFYSSYCCRAWCLG